MREAGYGVAARYVFHFERLYDRLAAHPDSGPSRPKLGPHIRIGVVRPYIVFYRHVEGDDVVSILRILHGRRRITRRLIHDTE